MCRYLLQSHFGTCIISTWEKLQLAIVHWIAIGKQVDKYTQSLLVKTTEDGYFFFSFFGCVRMCQDGTEDCLTTNGGYHGEGGEVMGFFLFISCSLVVVNMWSFQRTTKNDPCIGRV